MDLRTTVERQQLGLAHHVLGPLCKRQHDAGNGQTWRSIKHRHCILCNREKAAEWKSDNVERAKRNTRRRDANRDHGVRREKWPFAIHLSIVRRRAHEMSLPVTLTVDDLKLMWREQNGRCFWTGREISFFDGSAREPFRPSVDKLVPSLGYVPGNVVWSSNFANRGRGAMPASEFAELMADMGFDQSRYHEKMAAAFVVFGGK